MIEFDTNRIIDNAEFRDIYRKVLFIRCPEEMASIREVVETLPDAEGILAYCFVEEGRGLSFLILATGKVSDGALIIGPDATAHYARARFNDVRYYEYVTEQEIGIDPEAYRAAIDYVKEHFETKDRITQMVYDLELIDRARNLEVPEYVSVVLQQEGLFPELVWAKVTGFGTYEIFGEIAHAPGQGGFGLAPGQRIGFRMVDYGEGITLMWDPEIALPE